MRKEWNIETVDITPVAPQKQEENVPLTKKDKIKRFFKKNRRRIFLGVLCSYFVFVLFSMLVSDYYIDENGIRQPIVLSFEYLAVRDDYRTLLKQYKAIEELVVDITVVDIHLANEDVTEMEAATQYSTILDDRLDVMIPKITAMELGDEQIVLQQSMETLLSNDIAVYLQKIIEGLKTGNADSVNTALVWREKSLAAFDVIRSDMANLCDRAKADSTFIREWNLSDRALEKDASAYLKTK
jgi:hypothetical protein